MTLPPDRPQVIVLGASEDQVQSQFSQYRDEISQYVKIVYEDFSHGLGLPDISADFVIVFGGDGSILRAARQMGTNQIPVLGVNLGRLGFLADVAIDDINAALADIVSGRSRIVEHLMFHCEVVKNGEVIKDTLGLNETAILGGPPYSILEIRLSVDGELVTIYSCDGLIISTPVGSTAHSLSAGGPILRKNLHAFVISAISPHTLTVRPVVDSADRVFEARVSRPNNSTAVVVDGQPIHELTSDDSVRVKRSPYTFKLIELEEKGYYRTLREKLGWGGRMKKFDCDN